MRPFLIGTAIASFGLLFGAVSLSAQEMEEAVVEEAAEEVVPKEMTRRASFTIDRLGGAAGEPIAEAVLRDLEGVLQVKADYKRQMIVVDYDARAINNGG